MIYIIVGVFGVGLMFSSVIGLQKEYRFIADRVESYCDSDPLEQVLSIQPFTCVLGRIDYQVKDFSSEKLPYAICSLLPGVTQCD